MRFVHRVLVVAALLVPVAALADDASDRAALARQTVDLAIAPGLEGRISRMISQVAEKLPADKQAQVRTELTTASAAIREDLISVFAGYYAGAFTADELKGLVGFYSSPLGRKAVKVEEDKPAEVNEAIQQQIMRLVVLANTAAGAR